MVRHRSRNRKWKPEVKSGSGKNISAERAGEATPTATPTFSTMPDLDMALPTQPDIVQHRKPEMSDTQPEVETGSGNSSWAESVSDAIPTAIPTFSTLPDSKWHYWHGPASANIGNPTRRPRSRKWKQEVKTGSGNNFWTEGGGEKIATANPTFSTVPDLYMALPTQSDIGGHPKFKMAAPKTRSRNNFWTEIDFDAVAAATPHFRPCPT